MFKHEQYGNIKVQFVQSKYILKEVQRGRKRVVILLLLLYIIIYYNILGYFFLLNQWQIWSFSGAVCVS